MGKRSFCVLHLSILVISSSDIDSAIHSVVENPTVIGYVVLSPEGIPIRHHERMPYNKAVRYASLITDFALRAKSVLGQLNSTIGGGELENFRFRTNEGTEIVTTACSDYLLVVIQNCTGQPWKWVDDQ